MNAKCLRFAVVLCLLLVGSAWGQTVRRQRVGAAGAWKNTQAVAVLDGWIYSVENGGLYRTDPNTGEWVQIGAAEFGDTQFMVARGSWLYTIESDGSLYLVGPGNGAWQQVGETGAWFDTVAATVFPSDDKEGYLMTVESDGGLYTTFPDDGFWMQVGRSEFGNSRFLFAAGAWLYTIEADGSLYQVHPVNGSWRRVGEAGALLGTVAGAVLDDRIYTADDEGGLYETDPTTGEYRAVVTTGYEDTEFLFAAVGSIYSIDSAGNLYRTEVDATPRSSPPPETATSPAVAQPSPARPTGYAIERTAAKRVRAVYRAEIAIADVVPSRWMIATALAPELPSQTGVTTLMVPPAKVVREAGDEGRLLLIANFGSTDQSQPVAITYEATLWTRRLIPAPNYAVPAVAPLGEEERSRFLRATGTLDFETTVFQDWLDGRRLRRGASEDEVDFGKRVFAVILRLYRTRERAGTIKGQPASVYCGWDTADCKVRAVVFAAALRANGVRARTLGGILATSQTPNEAGEIDSHMRAEFFAHGVGWVPVEFNYALSDPQDPLRSFGYDAGDMFVQHIGTHVAVPRPGGGTMTAYGLDRPAASVSSKGTGTVTFRTLAWEVAKLPMSPQAAAAVTAPPAGPVVDATPVAGSPAPAGGTAEPLVRTTLRQMDMHPLGDDRFRVAIEYLNTEGVPKTGTSEGTKDEIRAWLKTFSDLPAESLQKFIAGVDLAGRTRTLPNFRRPMPPLGRATGTGQAQTPAGQPGTAPRLPPTAPDGSFGMSGTSGSFNIKPLGEGRFLLDVTNRNTAGETRSRKYEGTKEEILQAIDATDDLTATAKKNLRMLVEKAGQPRQLPPGRRIPPLPSRPGAAP